jgi:hypothetical protein
MKIGDLILVEDTWLYKMNPVNGVFIDHKRIQKKSFVIILDLNHSYAKIFIDGIVGYIDLLR